MRNASDINDHKFELPSLAAEISGQLACKALEAGYRAIRGQYFTPRNTAAFLAGMFETKNDDLRLLDAGAGVGALSAAFVEEMLGRSKKPRSMHLTVWEAETTFIEKLQTVLQRCVEFGA